MRLYEYEQSFCRCGCDQKLEVAHDPEQGFLVDHFTCQAGRAIAQVVKQEQERAERENKKPGWDDGRHYYISGTLPKVARKIGDG